MLQFIAIIVLRALGIGIFDILIIVRNLTYMALSLINGETM